MRFNLPDDFNKEEINFRYLKDVIPAQLFLRIFYKEEDGRLRPLSSCDIDSLNKHINSEYEVTTVLKQMIAFTDLIELYGNRLTSLSSSEFYEFVDSFVFTNAYKYGNLLLTEMQNYGMIDNYDKNSTITTEYEGKEFNDTSYLGTETNSNSSTTSGSGSNTKSGSETDVNTKSGSEKHTNGLTQTTYKNATNNNIRANLTIANEVGNSGDDVTTYNNVQDSKTVTYNNVKDSRTLTYNNVKDDTTSSSTTSGSNSKSFEDREDNSTRSFENRKDIVTERTSGNIGVTTTAQMLQGERDLSDFSVFKIMFEDIVKSVSVML